MRARPEGASMRISLGQSSGSPRIGGGRGGGALFISFLLAACQEQPTSPATTDGTTEQVTDFEVTPEGMAAAQDARIGGSNRPPPPPGSPPSPPGTKLPPASAPARPRSTIHLSI